jgi:hypothetical protein
MKTEKKSETVKAAKKVVKVVEKAVKAAQVVAAAQFAPLGRHGRERATVETLVKATAPLLLPALSELVNRAVSDMHGGKDSLGETEIRVERTLRLLGSLGLVCKVEGKGFALTVQGAKVYGGKGFEGSPFSIGGMGNGILHSIRAGETSRESIALGFKGREKQARFMTGRVVSCLVACGILNDTGKGGFTPTVQGAGILPLPKTGK